MGLLDIDSIIAGATDVLDVEAARTRDSQDKVFDRRIQYLDWFAAAAVVENERNGEFFRLIGENFD